ISEGRYVFETYYHDRQTATQRTWPETSDGDASVPNREDLAYYGYTHGEHLMRQVTGETWAARVQAYNGVQRLREYKRTRPWLNQ
ncbi:MAG TPA: hypothetical protein PKH07_09915, partial [bacterium]|nr:hypothetical protein [bacterium]